MKGASRGLEGGLKGARRELKGGLKGARRGLEGGLKGASSLQTFNPPRPPRTPSRPLEGYLRRGVLGTSPAVPAANAGSLLCVSLRFWAQRARLQSMSGGRHHFPGAEGSAYPAGSPHGLRHRAALLDERRHQRSLGHPR